MADFNALHALINAYIKKNGVKAITGQILNGVLSGMVNALGKGYTIAGVATPTTDPGTMTGPCAYYASQAGTYTNFGGLVVNDGDVAMLIYDEQTWHKEVMFSLSAEASVDANVGTPWVNASFENGMLTFTFGNLKGNPGDAAGFGTVNATVDSNIGTPGVSVQTSGPDTAKNMTFQFTNLKGETGVTSVVVTVDNTSGNPACAVSLNGQELHLDFTGLKGAQGDTGVSADYPIAIVNNLTTSDPTSALSAQMGVQLESEISQLELKVEGFTTSFRANGVVNDLTMVIPSGTVIQSISSSGALPADINLYDENGNNQKNLLLSALPYTTDRDYYKGSTYVGGSPTLTITCLGDIEKEFNRLEEQITGLSDEIDGLDDEANYISGYRIENNNGQIEEYEGAILMKDFVPAENGDTIFWRYADSGAFPVGLSLYDSNKAYLGVTYWGANEAKERTFTLSNASVAYILASFKDSSLYSPEIRVNGVTKWERLENGPITEMVEERVSTVEEGLEKLKEKVLNIRYIVSENPAYVSGKYCTYNPETLKKVIGDNAGIGYAKIDISSILTNIQIKNFKFVPSTGSADTYFKVICFDSSDNLLREWTAPNTDDALLLTLSDIPNGTASIYLDTPVLHEDEIIVSFNVDVLTSIVPEETESESVLLQYNKPIYTLGGSARSEQPLVLLHFSDIHGGSDNLSRIKDFFDGHSDKINDVLHTGDALPNDWDNSFTFWGASGASGFLNVIGNHDVASYTEGVGYDWTRYAGKDAYDRYFAPYISSWGVTQPENADTAGKCYYYKDYHDVRLIVIDDMSIMKDGDSAQLSWIESALTGARTSGKQVLMASHFPNQITPFSCPFQCIGGIGEPNTGRSAVVSLVDSFIGDGGIFVAWITGHTHCDLIGTVAGTVHTQVSITVSTANYQGVSIFDNINRVAGTPSMDLYNIFKIDPYNKRLSIFRIGSSFDSDGRHIGTVTVDYNNGVLLNYW